MQRIAFAVPGQKVASTAELELPESTLNAKPDTPPPSKDEDEDNGEGKGGEPRAPATSDSPADTPAPTTRILSPELTQQLSDLNDNISPVVSSLGQALTAQAEKSGAGYKAAKVLYELLVESQAAIIKASNVLPE